MKFEQSIRKNFRKYFQIHIVEFKNVLKEEVSAIIFSMIFGCFKVALAFQKAICLGGLSALSSLHKKLVKLNKEASMRFF